MKGYVEIDWKDGYFTITHEGEHWPHARPEAILKNWREGKFFKAHKAYKENVSEIAKIMYELLK